MPLSPDLSIILPSLQPSDDLVRCIYSIKAALNTKTSFEIILVVPDPTLFSEISSIGELHIHAEDCSGIYGAMNNGIAKATGRYLYFIGQDDILLPAATEAIAKGKANDADLILADVYWGNGSIFKNYPSTKSLVWRNWCHQAVFYNRSLFLEVIGSYPVQFRAQADHYVNIVYSSTPKTKKCRFNGCVAWYSSDGFSSKSPDLIFRHAFPEIVRKHIGFFSYTLVILRRALLKAWCFERLKTK